MTNRVHALGFSEKELAILNARVDASVLDEDAWEDATDESGVDCEMLFAICIGRGKGARNVQDASSAPAYRGAVVLPLSDRK